MALVFTLAGCSTGAVRVDDSHLNWQRTFDIVLASVSDQTMDTVQHDLRHGTVVGRKGDVGVSATMAAIHRYGHTSVSFAAIGDSPAAKALLERVVKSYHERMSAALKMLPSSKS